MKKFIEQFRHLERLDALIRRKATGTPSDLASRLNVSERTIYKYLDALRSLGAEVAYSRDNHHYYYENNFSLKMDIGKNDLNDPHSTRSD